MFEWLFPKAALIKTTRYSRDQVIFEQCIYKRTGSNGDDGSINISAAVYRDAETQLFGYALIFDICGAISRRCPFAFYGDKSVAERTAVAAAEAIVELFDRGDQRVNIG